MSLWVDRLTGWRPVSRRASPRQTRPSRKATTPTVLKAPRSSNYYRRLVVCHLRSLLSSDQRKEVVLTLADSLYGTLEVTGR
jgi:hypothetical protein